MNKNQRIVISGVLSLTVSLISLVTAEARVPDNLLALPHIVQVQLNVNAGDQTADYIDDKEISISAQQNNGTFLWSRNFKSNTDSQGFTQFSVPPIKDLSIDHICAKMNGPYYCFVFDDYYEVSGAVVPAMYTSFKDKNGNRLADDSSVPLSCKISLNSSVVTQSDGTQAYQSKWNLDCALKQ